MSTAFVPPCIPTRAPKPPAGPDWVHEIKHDGYRLQVRREGDVVRLFTHRGYDLSGRYPAIAVTATYTPRWELSRPPTGAVLDRRCARRPHHRAGRDERMAPPGAEQKNDTRQESKMPSDQIP